MLKLAVLLLGLQTLCLAETSYPITQRIEDLEPLQGEEVPILYRLPNNTVPTRYEVTFQTRVDIPDFSFSGVVRIGIRTREPSTSITLHHRQLTIVSALLWTNDLVPVAVPVGPPTYVVDTEKLTIPVLSTLPVNTEYTLVITYEGILRTNQAGLYRSSYTIDGQQRFEQFWDVVRTEFY